MTVSDAWRTSINNLSVDPREDAEAVAMNQAMTEAVRQAIGGLSDDPARAQAAVAAVSRFYLERAAAYVREHP